MKKLLLIGLLIVGCATFNESSWWMVSAINLNNEDKILPGGNLHTEKDAKEKAIEEAKKLAKRYKTNIIKIIEHEQ